MRRVLYTLLGTLLFACGPWAQGQSHVVSSEKLEKLRSVYLKIKAPDEASGKLHELFAKAAEKRGLLLVDDPHKAASVIDVTLKQKSGEGTIYADLIAATLVSRNGSSSTVYSCKLVEDGKRFSTITKKNGATGTDIWGHQRGCVCRRGGRSKILGPGCNRQERNQRGWVSA